MGRLPNVDASRCIVVAGIQYPWRIGRVQQTGLQKPERLTAAAQRRADLEMMLDELCRPTAAWFGDDLTSKLRVRELTRSRATA